MVPNQLHRQTDLLCIGTKTYTISMFIETLGSYATPIFHYVTMLLLNFFNGPCLASFSIIFGFFQQQYNLKKTTMNNDPSR